MKNNVIVTQKVVLADVVQWGLKTLKYSVFPNFFKKFILDYDDVLILSFQLSDNIWRL